MVIFQYAILGQNQRIQQKVLLSIFDHGFISIRYFPHYTLQLRNIYYFYRLIHANYVFPHFWKNENNSSNKNLHYYLKILFCRMLIILLQLSNQSSHQRCSVKKGVFRNFTKFIGKHLCQRLFFNKVAGAACLRTPFLQNTSGRLLLGILVSKDVLRDISFSDIKLPCCYRELDGMKSVKVFIWKYRKLSFEKNLCKTLKKEYI